MARISRAHPIRVALATCAATAIAGLSFGVPVADAGALGAVTGQAEEVASQAGLPAPPLQPAVEAVAAPVEAATAPVERVIAGAAPPAGVPRPTPSPSVVDPGALPDRATSTVTGVAAAAGTATRSAGGIVEAAKGGAEAATGTALPPPPVPTGGAAPASPDEGGSAEAIARPETSAPPVADPTTAATTSQRNIYVPAPANDGSTGAPLPRWIAYVWPAVALTGPYLAIIGERLREASTHLTPGPAAGGEAAQGVAGVHASGGSPAAGSSPLFQKLPSDVGHAFSSVPTAALIYLGVLVLAVIAVGLAVRREIAVGRRQ